MDEQNNTNPQANSVPPNVPPSPEPPPSSAPSPGTADPAKHNTGMAILCYLGILVIIPLLTDAKNDPFVKYHAKQGLALLIVWVLGSFFFWVPVLGWLLWIAIAVLAVMGIMHAAQGQTKELPFLGQIAKHFNF